MHIDREDMLELTRRMTIARNCFNRVAGAYMDEEGFIDGSFNTHFLKLSPADKEKQLAIAKTIPYAKTNEQLKNFRIDSRQKKPGSIWHLLTALRDCELKNDALLYSLYEYIGERYVVDKPYTIEVFCGNYDVPVKGADKESQWESEEVYRFRACHRQVFYSLLLRTEVRIWKALIFLQKMGRVKNWLICLVCSGGDDDMRTKQNYQILTFHTTTAAMAMEDYCHEQKIPGRLIPLPQEISAGCGLAWRMLPGEYEQEKDRIEKSGIVIESNIIIMI